jgi:transcriptional regulator with XRE-family HTH domain
MKRSKASDAATTEDFVTLLRRHRVARGLTQTKLAGRLKVDPSAVSQWESGSTSPSPENTRKLARVLGIDAMTLTQIIEPELAQPKAGAA